MNKDHILHLPGFLNHVACQYLIDLFESLDEYHEDGTVGENLLLYDAKKCTEIYFRCHGNFGIYPVHSIRSKKKVDSDPVYEQVDFVNCLVNGIDKYTQEYPFLDTLPQTQLFSGFKIQKYNPGECYSALHCESMGSELDRVLAWMIYLNDVTEGGETEFPSQDKKFQPRCGDFLIWPAHFTHPHRGMVSKTQVKYIITGWTVYEDPIFN